MNNSIASQLAEKINHHYRSGNIDYNELIKHLQKGKIDSNSPEIATHVGFTQSESDSVPAIFYYSDNSILILTGFSVEGYIRE